MRRRVSLTRSPRRHGQHRMIQPTSMVKAKASASSVSTAMVIRARLPSQHPLAQTDVRRAISALPDDFPRAVVSIAAAEFCHRDLECPRCEGDLAAALFERRRRQIDRNRHQHPHAHVCLLLYMSWVQYRLCFWRFLNFITAVITPFCAPASLGASPWGGLR